jgi:hypothetical protein
MGEAHTQLSCLALTWRASLTRSMRALTRAIAPGLGPSPCCPLGPAAAASDTHVSGSASAAACSAAAVHSSRSSLSAAAAASACMSTQATKVVGAAGAGAVPVLNLTCVQLQLQDTCRR